MTATHTYDGDELRWLPGFGEAAIERARQNLVALANRPADAASLINALSIDPMLDVCDVRGRVVGHARSQRRRFATDVLSLMARNVWSRTNFNVSPTQVAKDRIAEQLDSIATAEDRFAVARQILRRTVGANFQAVARTPAFLTYVQLALVPVTLAARIDGDQVRSALDAADVELAAKRTAVYKNALRLFGLRFRESGATADDFTLVVSGAMLGMSLRSMIAPERLNRIVDWQGEQWHLAALGVTGIVDDWLEVDPDYDPVAALDSYLRHSIRTSRASSHIVQVPGRDS